MYRVTLQEAIVCAKDFLKKANIVHAQTPTHSMKPYPGKKENGELIRASLELTRKLADLRNNR